MSGERIFISIFGKQIQLYNKEVRELHAVYLPHLGYKDVKVLMKDRIYRINIGKATVYVINQFEDNKIVIIRDDERETEKIINKVKGLIFVEVMHKFNMKKIAVKEYKDRISVIENDIVLGAKFEAYELRPRLLSPLVVYYGEDKCEDGLVAKEVMIPLRTFLNAVVFAIKLNFAKDDAEKARMLYESGKSFREIAKDLELSYTQARQLLIKAGTTFREREIPKSVREKIEELARQGVPAYKIAEQLNLNEVTVLNYLRKLNLVKRKKKLTLDEINAIVQMYKEGKSIYEIAKKLGRSTNLVVYYLKKLGLKR